MYRSDFKFLSTEQQNFTTRISMWNKISHVLQTRTIFSKTLMYSLYILAINKIESGCFIHFSAVPYETLTVSSMMNLYYNNLVIEDINILKGCGIHLKTKNINVLVASWIPSLQDVLKKLLLTRIIFLIILKEDIYIYIFWWSSRFVDEKKYF